MPLSHGKTYFVDAARGRDGWPGTKARPWRSLQRAVNRVPLSGSTIVVAPAVYADGLRFRRRGDPRNPITVVAAHKGSVTFVGTSSAPSLWTYDATGFRISGMRFTSQAPRVDTYVDNVLIERSSRIEISDSVIADSAMEGVIVRGGASSGQVSDDVWVYGDTFRASAPSLKTPATGRGWSPEQYFGSKGSHFVYAGQVGNNASYDYESGCSRLVIANSVFVGTTAGRDVELGPQARHSFVVNNTFVGNYAIEVFGAQTLARYAGGGVELYSDNQLPYATRDNLIANNIFADLDGHAVSGSGPPMQGNVVRDNLTWRTRNGMGYSGDARLPFQWWSGAPQNVLFVAKGNVVGNPLFVDVDAWDFHLRGRSRAVHGGDAAVAPPLDKNGRPRGHVPGFGAFTD